MSAITHEDEETVPSLTPLNLIRTLSPQNAMSISSPCSVKMEATSMVFLFGITTSLSPFLTRPLSILPIQHVPRLIVSLAYSCGADILVELFGNGQHESGVDIPVHDLEVVQEL